MLMSKYIISLWKVWVTDDTEGESLGVKVENPDNEVGVGPVDFEMVETAGWEEHGWGGRSLEFGLRVSGLEWIGA